MARPYVLQITAVEEEVRFKDLCDGSQDALAREFMEPLDAFDPDLTWETYRLLVGGEVIAEKVYVNPRDDLQEWADEAMAQILRQAFR